MNESQPNGMTIIDDTGVTKVCECQSGNFDETIIKCDVLIGVQGFKLKTIRTKYFPFTDYVYLPPNFDITLDDLKTVVRIFMKISCLNKDKNLNDEKHRFMIQKLYILSNVMSRMVQMLDLPINLATAVSATECCDDPICCEGSFRLRYANAIAKRAHKYFHPE